MNEIADVGESGLALVVVDRLEAVEWWWPAPKPEEVGVVCEAVSTQCCVGHGPRAAEGQTVD